MRPLPCFLLLAVAIATLAPQARIRAGMHAGVQSAAAGSPVDDAVARGNALLDRATTA